MEQRQGVSDKDSFHFVPGLGGRMTRNVSLHPLMSCLPTGGVAVAFFLLPGALRVYEGIVYLPQVWSLMTFHLDQRGHRE